MELAQVTATRPRPLKLRASVLRRERGKNERRIARALRGSDARALDDAYAAYGATVLAYLVDRLGDRSAAEDVRQQVFLELWQRRAEYDPERAGLFTWIMTITRSRAIDHFRKRVPQPQDPGLAEQIAEPADRGGESIDQVVERWRMAQLLRRIPPEEASVLRMRFYDELSQREIAERTGMPLGTVKMRMVQALERLRELLDGGEA